MIVVAVIAAVLAVFLGIAATRPAAYRVERALEMPEQAIAVASDLARFTDVVVLFGEPIAADKATLAIVERTETKVVVALEIAAPMKSKATYELVAGDGRVTWTMRGNHNFLGRAFGLVVNMDKMIGKDLELGLQRLLAASSSATAMVAASG